MSALKVAVLGAAGRMGAATCGAIEAAADLELVARIGRDGSAHDAKVAGAAVVVDFTEPSSALRNVESILALGMHAVVGTSGFDDERLNAVERIAQQHAPIGVVVAANFAVGAVLLMRFAQEAAAHFESVEIVELHHPDKVDAPSGTAVRTAEVIARARDLAHVPLAPDATTHESAGARGTRVSGVPVHAVRLRGLVAHEEVLFGNAGETLTIRHDSFDRTAFMPGVLLAIREVPRRPGLTIGLESLLGLG